MMMVEANNKDILLAEILECSVDELKVIEDCEVSISRVVDFIRTEGQNFSLYNFISGMFQVAFEDFADEVENRAASGDFSATAEKKIAKLDPLNDFELEQNISGIACFDIKVKKNKEIYKKFFEDEVRDLESKFKKNFGVFAREQGR